MMTPRDSARFFQGSLHRGCTSVPVPYVAPGRFQSQAVQDWFQRLMTPHPVRTYMDHACLIHEPGNGFPTTYVACSQTKISALLLSRRRAESRSDWRMVPIESAHNAHILHPDLIANLLLELC